MSSDDMNIFTKNVDAFPVIEVHGQLDLSNCHLLNKAINNEIADKWFFIVIDLNNINYIDSSCLGVLLGGLENVKRQGGSLAIVGNSLVDRVLTLTGLTRLFPFHLSVSDALRDLKRLNP